MDAETSKTYSGVSFGDAFRFWLVLGFISFGGPTGQISIMHEELVEKRKWISESRFLHALNYCMLLPGPEAAQLAIYIGWLLHRTIGGIVAGVFFILPSIVILWLLSYIYVIYGNVFWIASLFYGLKGAVMAIVAAAVLRIGKKALKNEVMWVVAGCAFIAIFFLKVAFPWVIFSACFIGLLGGKLYPAKFAVLRTANRNVSDVAQINDQTASPPHAKPSLVRAIKICIVSMFLWWTPVFLTAMFLGREHTIFREGIFFSKAAVITVGGAYAVLPYISQQAVEKYNWLQPGQMMDGLGLAETTPGPLIMVVQFVGFLGGWNHPGELPRLSAATWAALLTTWVTFVPCFLWIFLGAPHVEQLRSNRSLTAMLSVITAAVVGVVLNLAVWFAIHSLIPAPGTIDYFLLFLSVTFFIGIIRFSWNVVPVVIASGALGIAYRILS